MKRRRYLSRQRRFDRPTVLLAAFLASLAVARAAEPQAIPIDGAPFAARLARADANWRLEFSASAEPRRLAAADLVVWGAFVDPPRGGEIVLADGGLLAAELVSLDRDTLTCDGDLVGSRRVPLELVAGVVCHPPLERARHDRLLRQLRSADAQADRLILDNGDVVSGSLASLAEESFAIDTPTGPARIELARVVAVAFNPTLASTARPTGLRAMVGFADGSRLMATKLAVGAGKAEIEAAGLGPVRVAADRIVALQPFGGRAVYLSDLKIGSFKHIPFLQLAWPQCERDANVLGGPLRAGGKLYLKGLGMHSAPRITNDLDGAYRALRSELAIDDCAEGHGSVETRVFVDTGAGGWQPRYASPVIRGGQAPTSMSVDLVGVKRISLLVEFADRGDERDEADLLNARLVP